ncbi:glycosyltransferase family 2 protein [Ferroplasma acidiphilum]|uniref:glycosyltransferase family 2 protein n=1 Tax=Ferroplasma acidiphilum TaxID=74969 RepID=UPI002816338C|nr:glycosyltransferase [Ferroplasma acidiphilum]WMT53758.1 MAG: glycosyltransferase [Ferroplasma acidiphilum]
MENNKIPYISVIITAYNRKEFLLNAIKSVLNQTLDKKYYEIIVIKNFIDKNIDDFINKNSIIGIISTQESLGGKLIDALNISKGTVISFLEDDDLFFANKLDIVYKKFKKDSDIVYFHNRYVPINSNGKTININNMNTSIDFNISCISIKKSIVKFSKECKNIMSQDTLIYLYALESNKKIIKGKETLTYYMFHDSVSHIVANNLEEYRKHVLTTSDLFLNNYTLFNNLFHSKKAINVLNSRITGIQIYMFIVGANETPSKLINFFLNNPGSLKYRGAFFLSCILIKAYPKSRKYFSKKIWDVYRKWFNV